MALEEQGVLNLFTKSCTSIFLGLIPKVEIDGFLNISNDLRSWLYVFYEIHFLRYQKFLDLKFFEISHFLDPRFLRSQVFEIPGF